MREQPHYTNLLTEEFFTEHYIRGRMSYPKIREMLLKQGHNIHVGTLYSYAKKLGIGRNRSEAKRNREKDPLDWDKKYITESIIEDIDGFLLGDGGLQTTYKGKAKVSRLSCGVQYEEFCKYLMSGFKAYKSSYSKCKDSHMNSGFVWNGRSRFHPDLYMQLQRWYIKDKSGSSKKTTT